MSSNGREESERPPRLGGGALHLNWSEIPAEQVGEGIERQMVVGERLMACRLRFAPFVVTPEHEHPHEQMTIVERGRVRFNVEGEERVASAGDVLHFPPGCWHGATMLDEEVVLIDIFTPLREDFLAGSAAPTLSVTSDS
jgi:quercetin dioxygenase-like cupin family protein